MANTLLLNQPQVFDGLGTLTFTVPTTGLYSAVVSCTVPQAAPTGDGAGSNTGLGSGVGGGTLYGFATGGAGTSHGAVGQGFGADTSGYNQPSSQGSNQTSGSAVSSGVSILVKKNGSTIFTAPAFAAGQSALQFKTGFSATAADSITIVIDSSTASDKGLQGVLTTASVQQGL